MAGAGAALALAGAAWRAARRRRKPRKPPAPQAEKTAEHDDAEPDLIPNNYCKFSCIIFIVFQSSIQTAIFM